MINDKLFAVMCIPILAVIVFTLLPTDPTTSTIGVMAINLGVIFYLRKTLKGSLGNLLGGTKSKWECLVCHHNKFDNKGGCLRCGSRQRRLTS